MFGEKEIIGIKNLRLNNNRIILPSFTYATPNDELFFIFDHTQKHMILLQEKELMDTLDRIVEDLKNKVNTKEITYKEYLRYKRYLYGVMCIEGHKVDAESRILLPERGLKQLNIDKEVTIVGKGTKLAIFPNTEELNQSMKF